MERVPVNSSNIADIGYDNATMTLEVGFSNGSVYQYFDVPEALFQELMASESKGKFLNANVKNNYRYVKA